METEVMDLGQLAAFLQRDARELSKLADRGRLPGQKVGGNWRFSSPEIARWLEGELPGYSEQELTALERGANRGYHVTEPVVAPLMSDATVAVPLVAGTRASVLRGLVALAEQSWHVYDADALLAAVKQRDEAGTTALPGGVAIPHPGRPLSARVQAESLVAFGRTAGGLPFGAPDGGPTDLFFLVSCVDAATHLRVLARLSRLFLRPGFLDELRAAETPAAVIALIDAAEQSLAD